MALIQCPECKKDISTDAKKCPNCGKRVKHGALFWISMAFIGLFILFVIEFRLSQVKTAPQTVKKISKVKAAPKIYTAKDFLGSWQQVITNPTYPNSIARRYMRHTFNSEGTVIIENKADSSNKRQWEYKNGTCIVTWSYRDTRFTESYRLLSANELQLFYFRRERDGKKHEYKKNDRWLRENSRRAKKRTLVDIF